jgi:hypothetical protein
MHDRKIELFWIVFGSSPVVCSRGFFGSESSGKVRQTRGMGRLGWPEMRIRKTKRTRRPPRYVR